jgi:hypothetical protein
VIVPGGGSSSFSSCSGIVSIVGIISVQEFWWFLVFLAQMAWPDPGPDHGIF